MLKQQVGTSYCVSAHVKKISQILRSKDEPDTSTSILSRREWSELWKRSPRKELVEKVKSRKYTNSDVELISLLLMGEGLHKARRGRPSTISRDTQLACDYLKVKINCNGIAKNAKKVLSKKYNLPGVDSVQDPTFYKAVGRGLGILRANSAEAIEYIRSFSTDISELEDGSMQLMRLMVRFWECRKPEAPRS